jgi:hypothetical protein
MKVRVESYSGFKANERPLCFHLGGTAYRVEELLDQWYSPGKTYFRVRASDGNIYILCHDGSLEEGFWTLESFRREHVSQLPESVSKAPD